MKKSFIFGLILVLIFSVMLVGCEDEMTQEEKEEEIFDLIMEEEFDKARDKVMEYFGDDEEEVYVWNALIDEEELKSKDVLGNGFESATTTSEVESFKDEHNIDLTAEDVQYNMKNNLDEEFVIAGTAELSNYYNYGFDSSIEEEYFAVEIRPDGASYSDRWYLYFHRESFEDLYYDLREGEVHIIAKAIIPEWRFQDNQGNMAQVERVEW